MAMAIAETIPAELHHIPSQSCNLDNLERICATCNYVPMSGKKMHLILVDEADQMSQAAQLFLLSKLDGTSPLPDTIWVFTCNDKDKLQDRFLSRVKEIEFSSYGIATETTNLLERIWKENAPETASAPNFARLVKDSNNNVRASLMALETEIFLRA
jgi:replication-associated recombination protein RarA